MFLIPRYQAWGAAISTLCAETVVTGVQLFLARNIIDFKKTSRIFVVYFLNSIVMGLFVFGIVLFIKNLFISFICSAIVGFVVYVLLLFIEKNEFLYSSIMLVSKNNKSSQGV